ncbi:MAG: hypothetical protein U0869_07940 [Chloroflexota bacterium]
MSDDGEKRPEAQGNAGAFLAPFGGVVPVPMTPQGTEGAPAEGEDPDAAPPEQKRRSTLDWMLHRGDPLPKDL